MQINDLKIHHLWFDYFNDTPERFILVRFPATPDSSGNNPKKSPAPSDYPEDSDGSSEYGAWTFFRIITAACLVLLETDQDESFWRIIEVIEPQVVNFKIINLHLKVLSLKMKFYRKHNQNAEYLQAAGLYYELSERNEVVTRNMLSSMITLRKNLENMRKARMKAERKNMVLQERSEQDPLTRMANRFRLNDYAEEVFAYSQENDIPVAMEILDIDYFKEYNDNYGHQEGDRCLVSIANTIRNLVEEAEGFCARYGGDEFVIIYANVTREQAVSFAEELRRRVLALEMEHRFSKALPVVTISQGICWGIPRKGNRSWDFLHAADNMLYRVKKFSRNKRTVLLIASRRCVKSNAFLNSSACNSNTVPFVFSSIVFIFSSSTGLWT